MSFNNTKNNDHETTFPVTTIVSDSEDHRPQGTPCAAVIDVDIESEGGHLETTECKNGRAGEVTTRNSSDDSSKQLQSSLQQEDPRLATDQVVTIINDLVSKQKQAKTTNKILAIGLVATSLTGAATTTYLALKESNHADTMQLNMIKEFSISDAVVVQMNESRNEEFDHGHVVVGIVALEDVEQAWRDARKGLPVTSTVVEDYEDSNERLETVFTVDAANAKLLVGVDGNKTYSNLATQTGAVFEVECAGHDARSSALERGSHNNNCKVLVPSVDRLLGGCTIL